MHNKKKYLDQITNLKENQKVMLSVIQANQSKEATTLTSDNISEAVGGAVGGGGGGGGAMRL